MLEDTNSLDAAKKIVWYIHILYNFSSSSELIPYVVKIK